MTQDEFKELLTDNNVIYNQDGKWLIIDHEDFDLHLDEILKDITLPDYLYFKNINNFTLNDNNLKVLPPNLIFDDISYINLTNNNLKSLPNTIIFKNIELIDIENEKLILDYYPHVKIIIFNNINQINIKYLHEKMILICRPLYYTITHQTPHICLTKVLENPRHKKNIEINLPKNFLSMAYWI